MTWKLIDKMKGHESLGMIYEIGILMLITGSLSLLGKTWLVKEIPLHQVSKNWKWWYDLLVSSIQRIELLADVIDIWEVIG